MNSTIAAPHFGVGQKLRNEFQTYRKRVGNRLRKARQHRKETVDTAAQAVNISPNLLEKIENGEVNFKVGVLFDLCEHYEIETEQVV